MREWLIRPREDAVLKSCWGENRSIGVLNLVSGRVRGKDSTAATPSCDSPLTQCLEAVHMAICSACEIPYCRNVSAGIRVSLDCTIESRWWVTWGWTTVSPCRCGRCCLVPLFYSDIAKNGKAKASSCSICARRVLAICPWRRHVKMRNYDRPLDHRATFVSALAQLYNRDFIWGTY